MKTHTSTIGTRLRRARTRLRLTLTSAAQRLHLSWETLWEIECGQGEVPPGLLERAAEDYGVPLLWLETGQDEPAWALTAGGAV